MIGTRSKSKRLRDGGVGPELRSPAGLMCSHKETPLSGRRAGDAIAGGVRVVIFHADRAFVKCSSRWSWEA